MPSYDLRRLDGDPTYAPGRVFDKGTPWWRPTNKDIKAGFSIKARRLEGTEEEQCAMCRALTRELLQWREGSPKTMAGTWGWIIARYRSDDLSPMQEVKANTRKSYLEELAYWEEAIGKLNVADTTFETLKRLKRGMEAKDRSPAFIHRKFTHLRMVANYGLAVKPGLFRDICSVMGSGALKVRSPKPRTVSPTAPQVMAVIAAADAAGEHGFALGISLQWWLTLRAVDVRGQFLDGRWTDGLTWAMIDLKTGRIAKAASKTERSDGTVITWDLNPLPDLLARLSAIPADERIGPVIKRGGQPIHPRLYRDLFRKYARAAGVPDDVWMMDTRAGAITDGQLRGASDLELQHQAGHADFKTTQRYIRSRQENAGKVIKLRAGQ